MSVEISKNGYKHYFPWSLLYISNLEWVQIICMLNLDTSCESLSGATFRTDAAKMALSWCFIVVVMALLKGATAAQTYEVGDSLGWEVPPNISYYSKWASNKTSYAGDMLCKHFSIPFVKNGSSLIFLWSFYQSCMQTFLFKPLQTKFN